MSDDQTVVDDGDARQTADAKPVDAQDQPKAQPTLDEILDSFDQKAKPSATEPSRTAASNGAAQAGSVEDRLAQLERSNTELRESNQKLQARLESDDFDSEFNTTAGRLSDGLNVDAEAFKNELYGRVARDPRLVAVFEDRKKNPAAWKKVEGALRSEFEQRYPKKADDIDEDLTRERESMAATIRGMASTAPRRGEPSDEDIAKMTEEEFEKYQLDKGVSPWS